MSSESKNLGTRVSDQNLDILITALDAYAHQGVYDPWYLSNGDVVQPLDVLKELRAAREQYPDLKPPLPCPEVCVECGRPATKQAPNTEAGGFGEWLCAVHFSGKGWD